MVISIGDKFKTDNAVYTVTNVMERGGRVVVEWDCVGRKYWMKRVGVEMIEEWIADGRLVKIIPEN